MKYKVGDKVRVRKDLVTDEQYGCCFFKDKMEKFKGRIVTINYIEPDGCYQIENDSKNWHWTDEMFLPAIFTKSDLKTGHVVEYRDGQRRMVIGNGLLDGLGYLKQRNFKGCFNDDLTSSSVNCNFMDICKVYEVSPDFCEGLDKLLFNTDNLILIWERKEPPKKMTISEIEAALGHRVEVVAEVEQ